MQLKKSLIISDAEKRIGQTEIITDNNNPSFVKSVIIKYKFEERQKVIVRVFEIDDFGANVNIETQRQIGFCSFFLHEIIRIENKKLILPLKSQLYK